MDSEKTKENEIDTTGYEYDDYRTKTKLYLLISSFTFGIIGALLFFPLLMSVMAFDSPGSENSISTWLGFLCLFTFAPICFLSIVVSWIVYKSKKYKAARVIALSPLANIGILVCMFAIGKLINLFN